jgi:hypothetical protein
VPDSPYNVFQQGVDVVVWLAEKHAGHGQSMAARRREFSLIMV